MRVWALEGSEWINEIQNLFSKFSNICFALICKTHRRFVPEELEVYWQPVYSFYILTGEHEIPEKRELVDDNDRHLQT